MLFRHKHEWGHPRMEILTIREIISANGPSRDCWVRAEITERCQGCSATRITPLSANYEASIFEDLDRAAYKTGSGGWSIKQVTTPPPAKAGPKYHRKRCLKGHRFTRANTIVSADGTYRCRACREAWKAKRKDDGIPF